MSERKIVTAPFSDADMRAFTAGEMVYLSGPVYTARDAAHQRLCEMLGRGEPMPFDFAGQVVYYAGPCPAKPGAVIGSVGPTTASRMDAYTPTLVERGLKAMIGKGLRGPAVREALVKHGGVYFAAIGGAAALMSQCVKEASLVAFGDLGTEAIRRLVVEELPVVVAMDSRGRCVYDRPPK